MAAGRIGLLHPGEMGAAVGAALVGNGRRVVWASEGRSEATRARAEAAGLEDVGTVAEVARSVIVISVCPPHAALGVAGSLAAFGGLYVDANAVAPATALRIGGTIGRVVDGGIVGPPPHETGTTRLYLSGAEAATVAGLFTGSALDARVVSSEVGDASALKMAYAAWSKGTAALVLAIREVARAAGVDEALAEEWALSVPDLPERLARAERAAHAKGWRWVGEMEEIAATFGDAGQPAGFHEAAAEVFRRYPAPE